MLVSVLIANYNKKKYIKRCLNSLELQTYKKFEVIFFDDKSNDNSVSEVKKFLKKLNIKLIINNKKKFNITSYDQLNSYFYASKYAKGKLILFLDSDDFFDKNKIKNIVSYFYLNKDKQIIFDLPKIYFSKKKIKLLKLYKRISIASMWPRFPPQSCISIKSNLFRKISSKLLNKKFPSITLDFRIAVYSFFISKDFNILNNYLTYYFQDKYGESRRFCYLSKNWWFRRLEAHKYLKHFFKKNKLSYFFGIDFLITYIVCYFLNQNSIINQINRRIKSYVYNN
jgi:glycosyltransferase involved in cell wall biosynthesis